MRRRRRQAMVQRMHLCEPRLLARHNRTRSCSPPLRHRRRLRTTPKWMWVLTGVGYAPSEASSRLPATPTHAPALARWTRGVPVSAASVADGLQRVLRSRTVQPKSVHLAGGWLSRVVPKRAAGSGRAASSPPLRTPPQAPSPRQVARPKVAAQPPLPVRVTATSNSSMSSRRRDDSQRTRRATGRVVDDDDLTAEVVDDHSPPLSQWSSSQLRDFMKRTMQELMAPIVDATLTTAAATSAVRSPLTASTPLRDQPSSPSAAPVPPPFESLTRSPQHSPLRPVTSRRDPSLDRPPATPRNTDRGTSKKAASRWRYATVVAVASLVVRGALAVRKEAFKSTAASGDGES